MDSENLSAFLSAQFAQVRQIESNCADRKKLFVGNLPANTTLAELLEVFRKYGPVNEQLSVVKDDNYAFIHFYSDKDAEAAFKAVNDSFFKNRYIRVQYSTSQGHVKKSKTFDFGRISSTSSSNEIRPKSITKINKIGSSAQSSQCSSLANINENQDFTQADMMMHMRSELNHQQQQQQQQGSAFKYKMNVNSFSSYELSNKMEQQQQQQQSKSLRPITGGNRCSMTKSATNFNIPNSESFSFNANNINTYDLWNPISSIPIEDNSNYLSNSQSSSLLIPADSELNKQNQLKLLSLYKQHIEQQQQHQQHHQHRQQQLEHEHQHQQQRQQQISCTSTSFYDDCFDRLNLTTKRDSAGLFIRSNTISSFNLFN